MTAFPADWSVPAHDVTRLAPRSSTYAVVIPVINEGERIARQLASMHELGLTSAHDTIIADGGSTDGSTEPEALRRAGVGACLTKTGPGRLSAQLRMAYAWALMEGYEGIVTIDGNGKDSVESIPLFTAALDRGVDYAQASRFRPGGSGENTPLTRSLGIRLVHAPILSLAARQRLTDTTQGFRAYSRRLLLDPRVAPFREIFSDYELLAYMTVRAPRLGYRTEEIATRRSYPKGAAVPTKISGLRGHVDLLRTMMRAALGRYDPDL